MTADPSALASACRTFYDPAMTPLDPAYLSVLRVRAGLTALFVWAALLVAEQVWLAGRVPPGSLTVPAALLLGAAALLLPRRRYASWGFRLEEDELHVRHGLWLRVRTVVPFARVQHIDVTQGPVERRFGVGAIILHTAGTRSSAVVLPGLAFEEAGRIRDLIRARIRQDPM